MDLTVLIPTRARPGKLCACLAALARQTLAPERFEILVGTDGEEPGTAAAAERAWREHGGRGGGLRVIGGPAGGQAAVRNRLLPHARGRLLGFLNDDMCPIPDWCAAHLRAHEEIGPEGAIVAGDSPWRMHQPDRLFDRLVRETSMVFFHDQMRTDPDRWRDWGFRHAWMLNLSMPTAWVRDAGGLTVFPCAYGYEDDELAFRLRALVGARVLFRPDAVAEHDHRYEPAGYLERERLLGYAAWHFARQAPACACAMFGRDLRDPGEVAYARHALAREQALAERAAQRLEETAGMPAGCVDADGGRWSRELIAQAYAAHLPAKRWAWRKGFVGAAEDAATDQAQRSVA